MKKPLAYTPTKAKGKKLVPKPSGEGRNIIACPLQNIKTGDINEGAYKL